MQNFDINKIPWKMLVHRSIDGIAFRATTRSMNFWFGKGGFFRTPNAFLRWFRSRIIINPKLAYVALVLGSIFDKDKYKEELGFDRIVDIRYTQPYAWVDNFLGRGRIDIDAMSANASVTVVSSSGHKDAVEEAGITPSRELPEITFSVAGAGFLDKIWNALRSQVLFPDVVKLRDISTYRTKEALVILALFVCWLTFWFLLVPGTVIFAIATLILHGPAIAILQWIGVVFISVLASFLVSLGVTP